MNTASNQVAIVHHERATYPDSPPFHPEEAYPEYPFDRTALAHRNEAYRMVREVLRELGLDASHFGTPEWNPLGDFIHPGHRVVIKPNLVQDRHYRGGDIDCLITHGSVTRAVMDYVFIALRGEGSVTLGDAPVLSTRFDKAVQCAHLDGVLEFFKAHAKPVVTWFDFRRVAGSLDEHFHVTGWVEQPGDPQGVVEFNLGERSMLAPIGHLAHLFRLPHYRHGDTDPYHSPSLNRFIVPRCIMDADVVINLPKMKTHCKAGMTAALKNFVGIVAVRHCYTNFRRGSPAHDGDEYPDPSVLKTISEKLERLIDGNKTPVLRPLLSLAHRVSERLRNSLGIDNIRDGTWHGNDTVWRAILDLVRIATYGRPDGTLADSPQRVLFTLTDGLIAGEGEGPLEAISTPAGCLIAGLNPVCVDAAITTLMQFDWRKIPVITHAETLKDWPLLAEGVEHTRCLLAGEALTLDALAEKKVCPPFAPAYGWRGHIERE